MSRNNFKKLQIRLLKLQISPMGNFTCPQTCYHSKTLSYGYVSDEKKFWPLFKESIRIVWWYQYVSPICLFFGSKNLVEHKLVSFVAVAGLWTFVTLVIKLICTLLKWKYFRNTPKVESLTYLLTYYKRKKYTILAAMLGRRSYFV